MPGDDNSVSPIGERACQHVRTLVQCMSGANEGRLEPFRRRPSPFCKAEHANADAASARPDVTATGESVGWLLAPSHGFGSPRRKRRCLPCGATALSSSQRYGPTVGDHAKVTRQVAALRGHQPGVSCFPTGEKRFFDLAVSERTHPFVRTGTSRQSVRHPMPCLAEGGNRGMPGMYLRNPAPPPSAERAGAKDQSFNLSFKTSIVTRTTRAQLTKPSSGSTGLGLQGHLFAATGGASLGSLRFSYNTRACGDRGSSSRSGQSTARPGSDLRIAASDRACAPRNPHHEQRQQPLHHDQQE